MQFTCIGCGAVHKGRTVPAQPFYCINCRCLDCQIVFGVMCACGDIHGKRHAQVWQVCTDCFAIRERVVQALDSVEYAQRQEDIASEDKLYSV